MQPSLYTCYHQPLNLKFSMHVKTSVFSCLDLVIMDLMKGYESIIVVDYTDLMKGYESIIVVDYTNKSS